MNYPWLDDYLLSKAGAEKDYKVEWEVFRYMLRGKMFAMVGGDKAGAAIVTLKCEPAYGQELRKEFPEKIIAGYYMNKEHWNSLYLESDVPDEVLKSMADQSYALLLASFSKKAQQEILSFE